MSQVLAVVAAPRKKLTGRQLLKLLRRHSNNPAWVTYVAFSWKAGLIEVVDLTDSQIYAVCGANQSYVWLLGQLTGDEVKAWIAGTTSFGELQFKHHIKNGGAAKALAEFSDEVLFAELEARTAPHSQA